MCTWNDRPRFSAFARLSGRHRACTRMLQSGSAVRRRPNRSVEMNSSKTKLVGAAAALAAATATAHAQAQEVVVAHHADEVQVSQTRPNSALLSSGVTALAVPYLASVVVAAESDHPGDKN